jgi:hypothetical protein
MTMKNRIKRLEAKRPKPTRLSDAELIRRVELVLEKSTIAAREIGAEGVERVKQLAQKMGA